MSLIFHGIWTCSRSLLTYIMRWRVLVLKFQGLFHMRLIAVTGLPWRPCEKQGSWGGRGVPARRDCMGDREGQWVCWHQRKERKSDGEKGIYRSTHTKSQCEGEKLLCSLLAEGCVMKNFRMFLCAVCYLNSCTSLSRKPNIKFRSFSRLLRSDVCSSGGCTNGQKLASKLPRYC